MRTVKRVIALILAVAMLLSFAVVASAADKTTTISVQDTSMKAGETKTIPIKVTSSIANQIHAVVFGIVSENPDITLSFVTRGDIVASGAQVSNEKGTLSWADAEKSLSDYVNDPDYPTDVFVNLKVTVGANVAPGSYKIRFVENGRFYIGIFNENDEVAAYPNELVDAVGGTITVVAPNAITLGTTEIAAPTWAETSSGTKSFNITDTFVPTAYDKNGAVANGAAWSYTIKDVPVGQEQMIQLNGDNLVLNSHVAEGTQFTLKATAEAVDTFDSESISQDFTITVKKAPRVLSRLSLTGFNKADLPTAKTPTEVAFTLGASDQYNVSMALTETPTYTLQIAGTTPTALTEGKDFAISGTTLTLIKTDNVVEGEYTLTAAVGDVSDVLNFSVAKAVSVPTTATITMADTTIEIPVTGDATKDFTVFVFDQYGEPMTTGYEVTGAGVDGVSIEGSTVKVTADAKNAVAKGAAGTFTIAVKATGSETPLATLPVTIKRAESQVTSWKFTVDGREVTGNTAYVTLPADGSEITVTAVVTFFDQYGEELAEKTWNQTVSKGNDVQFGAYGHDFFIKGQILRFIKSDNTPVTVDDLVETKPATYGDTWSKIVTIKNDISVVAKIGDTEVPGTFSVANPTAKPNAGVQTYTIVFNSTDETYKNVTVVTGTVDVSKKLVGIRVEQPAAPISKVYDRTTELTAENKTAIQSCIILYGMLPGDTVSINWSTMNARYNSADVVGAEKIEAAFQGTCLTGKDAANYRMAVTTTCYIDASITPRSLNGATVTLNPTRTEYTGEPVKTPSSTVTLDGMTLVEGTDYQAVTSVVGSWTEVGTYSYKIEPFGGNFTDSASAPFEITPAPLTVTAEAKSKTYGDADPELTYKVDGLKPRDNITGSLTREIGENVGSYDITQGTLAASNNYKLKFVPAKLTITKAALTVTPDAKSKTYGETDPELTYTVSGLKNSDKAETVLTGALSRASGENVGEYAITAGTLAASNNYTLTVADTAKLTINKASQDALKAALETAIRNGKLTVQRAHEGKLEIGASFLGNTAAVSTAFNDEFETASAEYAAGKITLTAKAKDQAKLGATTISLTVSDAQNYEGTATVTVNAEITAKNAQSVTFANAGPLSASYAQATLANPATATTSLTYTSSDEIVATVDANGTVTFVKPGRVTITARAAETTDYAPAENSYTLTITKAVVTVSVRSASMTAGQTVPTFNPVVTGLNPKDSNIFRVLSATAATDGKTAGTYTVMVTAILKDEWKDYYEVRVQNGLLTVNPAGSIIDTFLPILIPGSACENGYADCACLIFTDLDATRWYHAPVDWAYNLGLMSGTTRTTFSPNAAATRAMTWTMLARIAGQDTRRSSTWYEVGRTWAMAQGITDGTNPMGTITREQLAAMLYRYVGSPAVSGKLTFADSASVSSWAQDAMLWAVQNGILDGVGGNRLNPKGNTTRAQAAAIFQRFSSK